MAWVNEGLSRSLTITVTKYVGGNVVVGYPHTYDGKTSWGDPLYPTISDTAFRQLTTAEFEARYAAFKLYVESVEAGLDFANDIVGDGATVYSDDCVTTTESPETAYAFSIKYAQYAVDVCDGTNAVVYCNTSNPQIGDVLYADSDLDLSKRWTATGANYVQFVSPALFGGEVIEVSAATRKLMTRTGFSCASNYGAITFSLKWTEVADSTCTGTGQCGESSIDLAGAVHILNSAGIKVKSEFVDIRAGATNPYVFTLDGLPLGDTYSVNFGSVYMLCNTSMLSMTPCSRKWSDAGHGEIMQDGYVTSRYAPGKTLYGEIKSWVPNI